MLPLATHAADNPAQAKAREALRQMYGEQAAQPAAPAVSQPKTQRPAAVPAPAAPKTPAQQKAAKAPAQSLKSSPPPAFTTQDSAAVAKAREALRRKMAELESGSVQTSQPTPAAAPTPATAEVQQAPAQGFSDVPATAADAAKLEKARTAVRQEFEAIDEKAAKAEQAAAGPGQEGFKYEPLQGPAVPFSPEQQRKLKELLKRYRADEITPEQYHAERAKIIAE